MTANEFREKYGRILDEFLKTEAGKHFREVLHQLAPPPVINAIQHMHYANMERRAGHEGCEKFIIFLSTPPVPNEEIEMTYGVTEKK